VRECHVLDQIDGVAITGRIEECAVRSAAGFAMGSGSDRNRIQTDKPHGGAFASQPRSERRRQAGVSLPVASFLTPPLEPGTEQDHVSVGRNVPGDVAWLDKRIIVRRDVDQNGMFADPERRRRLVERLSAVEKMARRIEVSADMIRQNPAAGIRAGTRPDLRRGLDPQAFRSAVRWRARRENMRQPERFARRQRPCAAPCSVRRCCISASAIFH
jgi:hypothetical protein